MIPGHQINSFSPPPLRLLFHFCVPVFNLRTSPAQSPGLPPLFFHCDPALSRRCHTLSGNCAVPSVRIQPDSETDSLVSFPALNFFFCGARFLFSPSSVLFEPNGDPSSSQPAAIFDSGQPCLDETVAPCIYFPSRCFLLFVPLRSRCP